jgi:puromycin-sensitive aminopeptidase
LLFFQPIACRQAFPCWDEPNFKATFDITLITPTKFDRTPIMSTYLVAYVVGEYDYVETKDKYGVSMRVYTQVGKKEHGQFALDVKNTIQISK